MTCVWRALFAGLDPDAKRRVAKPNSLPSYLKTHNARTPTVKVNGHRLTEKCMEENEEAVNVFDVRSITQGYLCSASDPFICLYSHVFKTNVSHRWHNGATIRYTVPDAVRHVSLRSNRGHMSYAGTKPIVS